ncbi:MAG: YbjQ family protein [Planctomycetaceae bacterium]|jgi:uncharacterized protein YbjQ (UPF0145 family)|nr:YbjQ family protein [Planctomycetaceae bacterium]
MFLTNTESFPGKRIVRVLGLVYGSTVRAKHIGRDIAAGLKHIFGGELKGYTELLADSRNEALRRMIEQANTLGGNAVVAVRFATSSITPQGAEVLAYGTAVVIEDDDTEYE